MTALFTITFMGKDGVFQTMQSHRVVFPQTLPDESGLNFTGWYYDEATTERAVEGTLLTGDITLYTNFSNGIVNYIVDGAVFASIEGGTIRFPETNPSSNKGNFAGWYYDEVGNRKAEEGTSIDETVNLYAVWSDFEAQFMVDDTVFSTVANNSLTFPSTNPTKDRMEFQEWYYDKEYTKLATEGDTLTNNVTLYAKFHSYITNKLNGAGIYASSSLIETSSGTWKYYQTYEEARKEAPDFAYLNVLSIFPAWVKFGKYSDGDVAYTYIGSKNIVEVKIISIDTDGEAVVRIDNNGNIIFNGKSDILSNHITVECIFEDGTSDIDSFVVASNRFCLVEGTKITLANGTHKNIEEITYEDKLLVWNFDEGCFAEAEPLWIKKREMITGYNLIQFDDGTELKTAVDHRIFNIEAQKFTYTMDEQATPIGTTVFKEDGSTAKLVSREVVEETVNYYNIITDYHMNLFADSILTSLRLNNLYPIHDMKFIKDQRTLVAKEEFAGIPEKWIDGLRLPEQPKEINRGNDVKHADSLIEYVKRLTE